MAHPIRVATVGPRPISVRRETPPAEVVQLMVEHWQSKLEQVLPDRPDLIVVPEACDRPADFPLDVRIPYYRERGEQILDLFRRTAAEHSCHVVYSAARELEDSTWRNSSHLLGPRGETIGVYNKNHPVIEETTEAGILCGKDAPVFECDLGRVACAICFDLNFDELRLHYASCRPELILFSSMYHGGLMQTMWAYSCRSYFVAAIAGPPSEIRNPFGEIVASTTNYRDYAVADLELDFCVAHLDYNRERLTALKKQYGPEVSIHDPGHVGSVLVASLHPDRTAVEMAEEFEIELVDDYFERALAHHLYAVNIEP